MLGLGPNKGSRIHTSLNNQPLGDTVLDRIFQQNVSSPNILTVLLGRSNDPAEMYPSNITMGNVLQGLEVVTSQPRVPVTSLQPLGATDQHWQVLLDDEDGIVGPDGQPIQVQSKIHGTQNPKQLTAIFDTGFSLPQVPEYVKCGFLFSWRHPYSRRSKRSGQSDIFWHLRCIAAVRGRSRLNMAYTL